MIVSGEAILEFKGSYWFLSNFYCPCYVSFDGHDYKSVEHAYQAAKTVDKDERYMVRMANQPRDAKRIGRLVTKLEDWEAVKHGIMFGLLLQKFERHADLRKLLIATGTRYLEEGNTWNDTHWGVCPPESGNGENWLGRLLMGVRSTLAW